MSQDGFCFARRTMGSSLRSMPMSLRVQVEHVSLRIINEVDGISRVTYDISGKPPATIEWE